MTEATLYKNIKECISNFYSYKLFDKGKLITNLKELENYCKRKYNILLYIEDNEIIGYMNNKSFYLLSKEM